VRAPTPLAGHSFGRLKVIEIAGSDKHGKTRWRCACACGRAITVRGAHLMSGITRSCGCLAKETLRKNGERSARHGHARVGHRSLTYSSWQAMLKRCNNPHHRYYKNYGGRGIKVCNRWLKFENFLADIEERTSGTTIDRIDNDGNYCKRNCRWATPSQQRRNQRGIYV
jgi:hypothetical protein